MPTPYTADVQGVLHSAVTTLTTR